MILCDYSCPECGVVEVLVERGDNGEAPDEITCGDCGSVAAWSPTPVFGRVKRVEVQRGGWQKPERKTWLDTRELGEGQDIDDFRANRRAVREEERKKAVMEMIRDA